MEMTSSLVHMLLLCVILLQCLVQTYGEKICIMVPTSTVQCIQDTGGQPDNAMLRQINCLQDLFWSLKPDRSVTQSDLDFIQNITSSMSGEPVSWKTHVSVDGPVKVGKPNFLYPRSGYRKRKEFRHLSRTEREKFDEAMRRMYQDGVIDIFARIHASVVHTHYGGPSFLPWNRMFLIYFEEALRRYDQTLFIPYWASPVDDAMDNPANSVLWTPQYFGNGEGSVLSGLGAYWQTDHGFLQRDFGRKSRLMSRGHVHRIYSQCRLASISKPTADFQNDIEYLMAGPHNWVGGDMSTYEYAGYDPLFYMHRAYVDFVWEEFRERQRVRCSVEPSTDYPRMPRESSHHRSAQMKVFQAFTNLDGIQNHWVNSWYNYDAEPACTDCCPGCSVPEPISCHHKPNVCVGRSTWSDGVVPAHNDQQSTVPYYPPPGGLMFESPPTDGRTRFTAVQDALSYAREQNNITDNNTIV